MGAEHISTHDPGRPAEAITGAMTWLLAPLAWATAPVSPGLCPAAVAQGWAVADGALVAPEKRPLAYTTSPEALAQLARVLDALARRGVRVVVVLLPDRTHTLAAPAPGQPAPEAWAADEAAYDGALGWFRDHGALAPDVGALARRLRASGTPYFRPDDGHWTVEGSIATARLVADALRADRAWPWIGSLPQSLSPANFVSERPGKESVQLARTCGGEPVALYRGPTYTLEKPAADSSQLLGDLPYPPLAVVGPSFVEPFFYFPQSLAAELDADVAPVAVAGGGMTTPLRAWLGGVDLTASRPDVLVWVISTTHAFRPAATFSGSLVSAEGYRQLLPAVDGGCRDTTTERELRLGGDGALLSPGEPGVPAEGHYLQLEGGQVGQATFHLRLAYEGAEAERLKIVPDERLDARPYTAVEFAQVPGARVVSIGLEATPGAPLGDVRARVCRRLDRLD